MNHLGIEFEVKNKPVLDEGFMPLGLFNKAFRAGAKEQVSIAVERAQSQMARVDTAIFGTPEMEKADRYYINRLIKTILWMKGGFKVYVGGCKKAYDYIMEDYSMGGCQEFDVKFMEKVYEHPFEVVYCDGDVPENKDTPKKMGGHMGGCRIGFDAGGSDRKVSAVIDGESVFDEEVVWNPKTNPDPDYHYEGIVAALKSAAEHLPRVDAVGVSSAGIYINNRTMSASLFIKVPEDIYEKKVKDIYIRAIEDTFGSIPYEVVNDGDVSALAGMISLSDTNVLGIAMGTSEAVGFVDGEGRITGWLNELAFVPVDCQDTAAIDDWSGDKGVGSRYFSQDSVIKLAGYAGFEFEEGLTPAQKLKVIQEKMLSDDETAVNIYKSIGTYLGHSLAYYYELYGFKHVLLLGRVMSGKGGDIIIEEAARVLADEYPQVNKVIKPSLPDEKFRRVGQSAAAASLPEVK